MQFIDEYNDGYCAGLREGYVESQADIRLEKEEFGHQLAEVFAILVTGIADAAVITMADYDISHVKEVAIECAELAKKWRRFEENDDGDRD